MSRCPLGFGHGAVGLTALLVSSAIVSPSAAAQPERPATWDMSREELRAIGLGQTRDYPVPVPDDFPRLNTTGRSQQYNALPAIIFLNFNGETLVGGADSAQTNTTQMSSLVGSFAPYGNNPAKRTASIQGVRAHYAAYNISVVDDRPEAGEYAMTMVGPTNPLGDGVLGVAPLDCGNQQTHSNISFAFVSADDSYSAAVAASTISHEQGHAFGLDHVDDTASLLNPFEAGGMPTFQDDCRPLTDGPGATCASVHSIHCLDGASQNSHLELLSLFGPAIPDTEGPVILITAPVNGSMFNEGDGLTVIATITDDSPITEADLFINGELYLKDVTEPWGWPVNDLDAGIYTLEILARDEPGNEGLSSPVSILVDSAGPQGGSGAENDDDDNNDGGLDGGTLDEGDDGNDSMPNAEGSSGDEGCGCTHAPSAPAGYGGLLLLIGLGLRRRRKPTGAPVP